MNIMVPYCLVTDQTFY